jgi:Zn-finger nucleic acid-binding protein
MQCPKCQKSMERLSFPAAEVDRCTGCQGIWFDMLEHDDLRAQAREIDIGSPKVGAEYNKIDLIPCPVCPNTTMIRMVDAQQPHIWFESCPVCFGRFFDAGEYRDLAEHSIGDFFKRFGLKARP